MIPFIPNPAEKVVGSHRDNHHFQWMIAQKEHTAPQHTRFILPPIHPTKSSLRCVGGIFLFRGRLHLENFMSRPNVIPALQSTPLQNRGRNFVRGKRRFTYMSSGTLYLFLRLNNSETRFERSSGEQEPSRGHKFSILENLVLHRDFTSSMHLHFRSDLVGACLPQTLLMVRT